MLQRVGKLAIPKFETALKKSTFKFGDKHIQDIIHDAPKSRKGEIMYRQLNLLLTVINNVSKID